MYARYALVVGLIGCAGQPASVDPSVTDRPAQTDATDPADTAPPKGSGISGRLVGTDGVARVGERVLACTPLTCLTLDTDADGAFRFEIAAPAQLVVKSRPDLDHQPRRGVAMVPCVLADDAPMPLGDVLVPDLSAGARVDAFDAVSRDHDLGGGLTLTLAGTAVQPALGTSVRDLAAGVIPPDRAPHFPGLNHDDVLAVYALHPFEAHLDPPAAVAIATDLPVGEVVDLYTIDALDGALSAPIPATSDGEALRTGAGAGLDRLTNLVVVRRPTP
jgi:hypothetical protein